MCKNIFFDLDGTLTDPRKRLHSLFQELTPESEFSFDEYWKLKRQRTNQRTILTNWFNYPDDKIHKFKRIWMEKVEEPHRLKQDVLFEYTEHVLASLSKKYGLYLVTARQFEDRTHSQLEDYKIKGFFKKILVTKQKSTKAELIKNSFSVSPGDVFIGDTGEDVLAGKELGLKTIAVYSGCLSKGILKEYNPDIIAKDVGEFYKNSSL